MRKAVRQTATAIVKIELVPHDTAWGSAFLSLRERLVAALGESALSVAHVGSTSIPGIRAKPIVDVLLVVADSSDETAYVGAIEGAGFLFHSRDEPDWHAHRLLKFPKPAANVHVLTEGCVEIDRLIAFRDLLRRDADARGIYERCKLELARRQWSQVQDYADAKAEIVEGLLGRVAEQWTRKCRVW